MVTLLDISYLRFVAVSITAHLIVFFILNSPLPLPVDHAENIPVSILEVPPKEQTELTTAPRVPRARTPNTPAIIAKKDSPRPPVKTEAIKERPRAPNESIARADSLPAPLQSAPPAASLPQPAPAPREVTAEQTIIVERRLPTIKELLPPVNWSADSRASEPVSLNTRDPVYVSYFTKIKQLINAQWEYPELALRYGLEGKLLVEFSIGPRGQMERLRLVRSSGSEILDQEALRAIKAAAPFPPIPQWIKANPLTVLGEMIYDDNRVNYQFAR